MTSLWGEGWGEGERGRRTDAAAQNDCGTRQTEPQFLAALDKNVRAPKNLRCARVYTSIAFLLRLVTPVGVLSIKAYAGSYT
jgi:hypothetical protein